jgi:uncharacterized protein (TIGR02646 family)
MRVIRKGRPPKALTEHRAQPVGAGYDNLPKQALWEALAKEQGYLCAYCMGRIEPHNDHMKIDHRMARNPKSGSGKATTLVYRNFLGVCKGGEGLARQEQHCDTYKGNRPLRIDPTDAKSGWERSIRYSASGAIASSSPPIDEDMNAVLNLNVDALKEARRSAVQAALEAMDWQNPGQWSEAAIRRAIARWEAPDEGRLAPYCEAILYFLRKRLAREEAARTLPRGSRSRTPSGRGG